MKRIKEKATDIEDRQRTSKMYTTGMPIKKKTKQENNTKRLIEKNWSAIEEHF